MITDSRLPLVTVGIPTFNRPQGLERTLQCIAGQTYSNLEIIVSDNCSTDPLVLPLLAKFANADKRISFHVQERNISIVPNFQYLLNRATGEYFMWAADDDNWEPDFIEVCVKGMQENPDVVLCMTDLKIVGMDGASSKSKLNRSFMQKNLFTRCFHFVKSTDENKYFFCGLYRTALVKDISFNNDWGGDHMFVYEAITKGKLLYLQGKSCFYYFRGGSSTNMERVRKAFNITSRFYFFEAYYLKYMTYQFGLKHLGFSSKIGLFISNGLGLVFNEDFILYYIFIKKPLKRLFRKIKISHNWI
jgi:glycosyltransferase involved in cell wall biosynthesis